MLYILNSLITPIDSKYITATVTLRRITVEEAKELLESEPYTSAIGHEGTASLLTKILDHPIPMNRISISMSVGDRGLHFVLKTRLPEGRVLSEEELKSLEFELFLSEVVDVVEANKYVRDCDASPKCKFPATFSYRAQCGCWLSLCLKHYIEELRH